MAFDFPSSPTTGQTYSVSGGPTYVYNGTAWVVLTPGNQFNRTVFTATAGQTTFSMNYVVGAIDVYRNGVKLAPADFTAINGTSIVLLNAATVGDTIEVISYPMITYSDAVKRTGDTMTGALAVPSLTVNSVPVLAGPAFFVQRNTSNQSITSNAYVKVQFNDVEFDTASCWDAVNYRFTPNVAGYYLFTLNVLVNFTSSAITQETVGTIYKNGGEALWSMNPTYSCGRSTAFSSGILYMNGTTDYVEGYVYSAQASSAVAASANGRSTFTGCLVRAA